MYVHTTNDQSNTFWEDNGAGWLMDFMIVPVRVGTEGWVYFCLAGLTNDSFLSWKGEEETKENEVIMISVQASGCLIDLISLEAEEEEADFSSVSQSVCCAGALCFWIEYLSTFHLAD